MVEAKEKLMEAFSLEKVASSLPTLLLIGAGILIIDKIVGIGVKLEPINKRVRKWNRQAVFEIIDSVGDNIQLLDTILKSFGIDIGEDNLHKLGDLLQNLATGGKHIGTMYDLLKPSLMKAGGSLQRKLGNYKERD